MPPTRRGFTLLVSGALSLLLSVAPALAQPVPDRLWIGPMPFTAGRTMRPDFFPMLSDPANWPTVLGSMQIFKSYLMILPDGPLEGKTAPELSDEQLAALATLCRQRGLKVAFEVGGLRQGPLAPDTQWGERHAQTELRWLRRWLRAGGTIDYLTTDHAVMMNVGSHYVSPREQTDCGLTLEQTIGQLAEYFVAVRRELPAVRLGVIESLGYFHVNGPGEREYARTVPALPVWHFEEFFDALQAALRRHDLELDHFHIDFGYEGVQYDGLREGKLDYGRVLGVERHVQSRGVKAGVIVNAFHDQSVKAPQPQQASREACERTRQFLAGYLAAGGKADHIVLQTWQPYPDRTGPETDPLTVVGLQRTLLQEAKLIR